MTRQQTFLVSVAVILAALYVYYFSDWFNPPVIQILPQLRPPRAMARSGVSVYQVSFNMDGQYKLTSIKVVPLSALATNKNALPVWHLVNKDKPLLQKGFFYGMPIMGMKPSMANARPQRLIPEERYRLFIEAGHARGQVDFQTREYVPIQ